MSKNIISHAQRIKEDEYVELRKAVERYKKQAPAEQHPVIDSCLRVMREFRAERAEQRPVVMDLAEGK
jgi:acetyl-CoA carboxylase alpha subunit